MVNIKNLIDDAKCFETVRQLRWPNGVTCPRCTSQHVTKNGSDETQPHRQRYRCQNCHRGFDDLTETIFAGHHQPLSTWILCLYFMGLNLSNQQIAAELDLCVSDVQEMTSQLREGIVVHRPEVKLSGTVECDEAYVTAGHKGQPGAVKKRAQGAAAASEGGTRSRHAGEGEATDFRHDATWR
jgi:transposase-like protein